MPAALVTDRPASQWVTKAFAQEAVGISRQFLDAKLMPRLKPEEVTGERMKMRVQLPAIIREWVTHKIETSRNGNKPSDQRDGDDALMSGPETPELDKLRKVSRELKEIELSEKRRETVIRSEILPALQQSASLMRQAVEKAVRLYGNPVGELLNEALNETEAGWQAAIAN